MGNITLSIPDPIQKEMKAFSEVKWSEIARRAIVERLELLKRAEELAKKSKLTEKEVKEFSDKIKKSASKRMIHDYCH
jgi:glutamyl-tRNA reductase